MAGHYSGIAQGVLRVAAQASDEDKKKYLERAWARMSKRYHGKTVYATLTANVILRSTTSQSFSVYFGQSFGNAKSVFYGQEHDAVGGGLRRLFAEFPLREKQDLATLPINFTTEDFSGIYKRNFARSNVAVHRVVSLVYLFSAGLENYDRERTLQERTPLRLF